MQAVLREVDNNLRIGIIDKGVHYGDTSKPALLKLNSKAIDNFYLSLPEVALDTDTALAEKLRSLSEAIFKCNRSIEHYTITAVIPVAKFNWERHEKRLKAALDFSSSLFHDTVKPKLIDLKNHLVNNLDSLSNFNL